jgi:hypothetical protein
MVRMLACALALALALSGCGQGGSPAAANEAADQFITALADGDVDEAWSHLALETRQRLYADDKAAFARDVKAADWSQLSWEFGPVVNFDYAWEVHGSAQKAFLPDFLVDRKIVGWSDPWFVMQVQFPGVFANDYQIIAWQE